MAFSKYNRRKVNLFTLSRMPASLRSWTVSSRNLLPCFWIFPALTVLRGGTGNGPKGTAPVLFPKAVFQISDTEARTEPVEVKSQNLCTSSFDNLVKSRIFPFFWIPAFAGMTIIQLISNRYHRRHTREGGYPVLKTTFYDSISFKQH